MPSYPIVSGEVQPGVLYSIVASTPSNGTVTYNGVTLAVGAMFRGVVGVASYTSSGVATVNEVLELIGGSVEISLNNIDIPNFEDTTRITGIGVEYELSQEEKVVQDVTEIKGFSIELIDYPFYSFEITETRL
jgi:hypothetical protein